MTILEQHEKIVWLASFPKSGNTWLRMFLDAYFLQEVDINDIICSVADDNSMRYQIGDGSDIRDLPVELQQLARPMAMLRLVRMFNANKNADIPLFVKTHANHMIVNGIEMLPFALTKAVIHIVRDPRDVLPSYAAHMGLSLDDAMDKMDNDFNCLIGDKITAKVGDFTGSWRNHTLGYLQGDSHNIMTFRYEEMKSHPVETFSAMLKHAGVEPDVDRVKKALELCELSRLQKQEKEKGFTESSPYAKNQFFGKKHEKLTPKIKHRIEKRFGRVMKKLGYLDRKVA